MRSDHPLQAVKAIYRYAAVPFLRQKEGRRPYGLALGFSPWKSFLSDWLPEYDLDRRDRGVTEWVFYTTLAPRLLADRNSAVFTWGYKIPRYVQTFCERLRIPIVKVEDGFLRSVQLGATKAPPLSLCMDRKALYFDASRPSTMEDILNNYDFDGDIDLAERSRAGIAALLSSRLSKYNVGSHQSIEDIYGSKNRKRVLVVGQVDGDMSILTGCSRPITNNDLVWIAASENPQAQIIYKPHPEVLHKTRKDPPQSDPAQVSGIAQVLFEDIALADAFDTVDHVYTITSLAGFEALIRGIKVTCIGAPFYSGWGLTDDRQKVARRGRTLTIESLFAAAYILYPRYYDPHRRSFVTFEDALNLLTIMRSSANKIASEKAAAAEVKRMEKELLLTQRAEALPVAPLSMNHRPLTKNEVHLEAIRSFRRLLNVIDPAEGKGVVNTAAVKLPAKKSALKSTAKKLAASKPAPKTIVTGARGRRNP